MNQFYNQLAERCRANSAEFWAETVLEGECAGEKRILLNEPEGALPNVVMEDGVRIFRERIGVRKKLYICGGGHVSMPIIRIGKMIGFSVTVLEDRPKFADNARAAGADQVLCEPFGDGLGRIPGDEDSWFVIVTRGHRYDTECLECILRKRHAYVGMMGSRRRVAIVKDQLHQKGVSRELLDSVHTPIGLKIGAETPEEIAVSIMAEIIQEKNKNRRRGGFTREILKAVLDASEAETKKVLATIAARKGSAPREAGTKMLVYRDGRCVGTIGGGCLEADIFQKALRMMTEEHPSPVLYHADMTGRDAEDEGMVCGGLVDVLLEPLF